MEKNKGGDPVPHSNRVDEPQTLPELGISKRLSSESQTLAKLPDEVKEKVAKGETSQKKAISTARQEKRKVEIIESAKIEKHINGEILKGVIPAPAL